MGSKRLKPRHARARKEAMEATSPRSTFEALVSAIESPEVISAAVLERLYVVLNHLCSNPQNGVTNFQYCVELDGLRLEVTAEEMFRLSDALSLRLSQRFTEFFGALCEDCYDEDLGNEMQCAAEILNLLLRCSLVVLPLLLDKQKVVLEKGRIVLGILKCLSSINLHVRKWTGKGVRCKQSACENSDSKCITSSASPSDSECTTSSASPSVSRVQLVTAMLEVFLDELLVSRQLRPLFSMLESFASRRCCGLDDTGKLIEIICNHFYLSFTDECAVENFLGRLFWMHPEDVKCFNAVELSPTAAAKLLLNPIIFSAPKFMQAHVIALISVATHAVDYKGYKPGRRFMICFLSVFERSVLLYKSNMFRWEIDEKHRSVEGSYKSIMHVDTSLQSYDCFLSTQEEINSVIRKLEGSSNSCLEKLSSKMKSDLVSSSIRFIKECQHVFDDSCQDEIMSILSCIIEEASDGSDCTLSHPLGPGNLEDLCILASVLKLMGSSLLQVIWILRHGADTHNLKTLCDTSLCKGYDSVLSTISCFAEYKFHFPVQKMLRDIMETNCTGHSRSRMMFLHFSGVLSYAFTTGLDFLVKGCLWILISLLNLFAFEEGNLYAMHTYLSSGSESIPSNLAIVIAPEASAMARGSSLMIASKIQKIRTLHLSTSPTVQDGVSVTGANTTAPCTTVSNVEEIKKANGEAFLKCLLKNWDKVDDFDELADFIECKEGKNYSSWLKDREKFRKWKAEKIAVLRWKKKKKAWRKTKKSNLKDYFEDTSD